jgi:hypothetical protein
MAVAGAARTMPCALIWPVRRPMQWEPEKNFAFSEDVA